MTLADPPPSMEFSIMDFFFEPFPYLEVYPEYFSHFEIWNVVINIMSFMISEKSWGRLSTMGKDQLFVCQKI